MLARPFTPGEAPIRCQCGKVVIAKIGDVCPAPGCHRMFPDPAAIHDALLHAGHAHGTAEVQRLAPVLGIEGGKLVTDGRRVFGVVA